MASTFFSNIGQNFQDPTVQKGLLAGLTGVFGAQKSAREQEALASRLATAPLLAGFDPKATASLVAGYQAGAPQGGAAPGGDIIQAMGPEIFSKLFSGKKGESAVSEPKKVFSKSSAPKQTPSINIPSSGPTSMPQIPGYNTPIPKKVNQPATVFGALGIPEDQSVYYGG